MRSKEIINLFSNKDRYQISLILLLLSTFTRISANIDLYEEWRQNYDSEGIANTLLDICYDGKIDAAIQTIDGAIYLFKRYGFVIVNLNGIKANTSYATKFTFSFFPLKPEFAITISDPNNVRYGQSFFFKNNRFYIYENRKFKQIIFTKYYFDEFSRKSKPFYYYGDSIIAFYDKRSSIADAFMRKIFYYFDFHSYKFADYAGSDILTNIPNYFNNVKHIVPLVNDSWLLFIENQNFGKFCMVNDVSEDLRLICNERNLNELIDCPHNLKRIVDEYWLIYIWQNSSLSRDRFLLSLKAILISILYGLSILYLITYFRYGDYKSDFD